MYDTVPEGLSEGSCAITSLHLVVSGRSWLRYVTAATHSASIEGSPKAGPHMKSKMGVCPAALDMFCTELYLQDARSSCHPKIWTWPLVGDIGQNRAAQGGR